MKSCCSVVLLFLVATVSAAKFEKFPLTVPKEGKTGFTKLSGAETGIAFTNVLSDARAATNRTLLGGSGVASGDVDGDGWCDLYFCGLDGKNALFKNLGGWKFRDVTTAVIAMEGMDCTGAVFADVDGDGDLDLLVNVLGGGTHLFLNDSKGNFSEVTDSAGLRSKSAATSMALADIDGDGDLDLYVCNSRASTVGDAPSTRFKVEPVGNRLEVIAVNGRPATAPDLTNRFTVAPDGRVLEFGEADVLYENDGSGKFKPVSFTSGRFLDEEGKPLLRPPLDWGLSVQFYDFNGDGAPDIYVCNDYFTPDRFWVNDGKGNFRAISTRALRKTSYSSMGVDFGDINRDGHPDFFVVDMLSRDRAQRQIQAGDFAPFLSNPGENKDRIQVAQNTLQLNRGDGTFAEISFFGGVEGSEWSWCPIFMDVDLDGWEDLVISNGHRRDMQNADSTMRIQQALAAGKINYNQPGKIMEQFPPLRRRPVAFQNNRDLTFTERGREWGFDTEGISHGMVMVDLDNDGDMDLVMNNLGTPAGVYRNDSAAPRIAVRLKGKGKNSAGVGAKIILRANGQEQKQEMICGGRYCSGAEMERTFAALSNEMEIRIEWRDGKSSEVQHAQPNCLYVIDEGEDPLIAKKEIAKAIFEDVSAILNHHQHQEDVFDDFARQPLLPFRLSQGGPGVSWHDYDRDGWPDLIIPAGRGGKIAVFRNEGDGKFKRVEPGTMDRPVARDQTTALGDGNFIFVGSSNYEDGKTNGGYAKLYDVLKGQSGEMLLEPKAATGPMAMADIDGDGFPDLFLGTVGVSGRYPEAGESLVCRREGPLFRVVQRLSAGLVSGAVFSDIDLDGDPDLLLACQWGPIRVFLNEKGELKEATSRFGLDQFTGLWNGIATADLNNDGRPDIIVSNWGRNSRWKANSQAPLKLYYGDFDGNGSVDTIDARFEQGAAKDMPIMNFIRLGKGLPMIQERNWTFEQYANAGIDKILGEHFATSKTMSAATLSSMVFLNTTNGFVGRELPAEAQFAPGFGIAVGDFNGDGNEDVFLAQNFFAMNPEMPRLDAGRGLLMIGNGKGQLTPVSGTESGIEIYGEQRGAATADYDGDGRLDLVVAENAAETKLFHNSESARCLTVRLIGGDKNQNAIGAEMRLRTVQGAGPLREVQSGSGYWSLNSTTQLLGPAPGAEKLEVRFPAKNWMTVEIPKGATEIAVTESGKVTQMK